MIWMSREEKRLHSVKQYKTERHSKMLRYTNCSVKMTRFVLYKYTAHMYWKIN